MVVIAVAHTRAGWLNCGRCWNGRERSTTIPRKTIQGFRSQDRVWWRSLRVTDKGGVLRGLSIVEPNLSSLCGQKGRYFTGKPHIPTPSALLGVVFFPVQRRRETEARKGVRAAGRHGSSSQPSAFCNQLRTVHDIYHPVCGTCPISSLIRH